MYAGRTRWQHSRKKLNSQEKQKKRRDGQHGKKVCPMMYISLESASSSFFFSGDASNICCTHPEGFSGTSSQGVFSLQESLCLKHWNLRHQQKEMRDKKSFCQQSWVPHWSYWLPFVAVSRVYRRRRKSWCCGVGGRKKVFFQQFLFPSPYQMVSFFLRGASHPPSLINFIFLDWTARERGPFRQEIST